METSEGFETEGSAPEQVRAVERGRGGPVGGGLAEREGPSNLLGGGCTLHATRHRTDGPEALGTGETQAAGEGLGARARKGARSGESGRLERTGRR